MTTTQDDPIAKALLAQVRQHLTDGTVTDFAEDQEAIESLDASANHGLKVKLDQLRRDIQRHVVQPVAVATDPQPPDQSTGLQDNPFPTQPNADRPGSAVPASQGNITTPVGPDEYTKQRTRFQMIEAEIPSANKDGLAALLEEIATLTTLPAVERTWMSDQVKAETRRR